MAVTVGKLLENATVLYGMKLLAGQKGINNLVEWVHIVEDSNVSKFLHGNEIIFTAGILNKYDDWLLEYVKLLNKAGASAFVVNLGPYIKEISKEVIEYCDNVNMPLFSMPWETKMVDVTRDVCYKIMKKNQVDLKVIFYNELDIYKLLINIKDKELIREFYESVLGSLERYDEKNNTNLMDFLKIYLDSNGSQHLVAEKQFIHRNTVNNMIKKIYKITGYNPAELGDKMKFLIGFYIKDII